MSEPIRLTLSYPNEKQQRFLECTAKYIAFGGARGGGKSWAVRTKAILLALGYAGIRLLIVRRTYQELESNHIRILRPQLAQVAEYKATTRTFTFLNGSTLEFGYCASDGDMDRYQGAEYDVPSAAAKLRRWAFSSLYSAPSSSVCCSTSLPCRSSVTTVFPVDSSNCPSRTVNRKLLSTWGVMADTFCPASYTSIFPPRPRYSRPASSAAMPS